MVLEKDSSILGYHGEISKSLNADHHDVCKFKSPEDPRYVNVRNALKPLVSKSRPIGAYDYISCPGNLCFNSLGEVPRR